MDWKKIGKALLYPHIAVMIALVPTATAALVCSMIFLGSESLIAIFNYVIAAYTLTVWCVKIPDMIGFFKRVRQKNKFLIRWHSDARLRINVTLSLSLMINAVYGLFQIWLGVYHRTFWFLSLGTYYLCLGAMRYFLFRHTRKYAPGEEMKTELVKYSACGWIFLLMNLALSLIVFFMVYWNRTFEHHMITAIAMAAYTFASLTAAIINLVKFKKFNSPVFSATKAISFAAACVSMLTLTSTLLTTFKDETMSALEQKIMLGCVGFAVSGVVLAMAIRMIVKGTKELKQIEKEV